jgi:hypothetical protein
LSHVNKTSEFERGSKALTESQEKAQWIIEGRDAKAGPYGPPLNTYKLQEKGLIFQFCQGHTQILEVLELANYLAALIGTSNINHKSVINSLCVRPLIEIVAIVRLAEH